MYVNQKTQKPTLGSLFAGIGGFDLGFERAGFRTAWQVEIDPVNRAVLAGRFPHAERFEDVRECGRRNLAPVDVIVGGFPCQDVSTAGARRGLAGERSGLFFEAVRILEELRPAWVVVENVPGLLHSNDCRDFQTVIESLAECGYVGLWRVLNARYFGVPQARRRVFLVAGLGRYPPSGLLDDAGSMEAVFAPPGSLEEPLPADSWAAYSVLASNTPGRISLGSEILVAHQGGWGSMVERAGASGPDGVCKGLDEANAKEAWSAGNAVVPQVAEWIARHLMRAFVNG